MTAFAAAVPVLPVADVARSCPFYEEALGFRVRHADAGYAVLARDAVEVHLWAATDESWRYRAVGKPVESGAETFLAGTASCRVHVDDIDGLFAELDARGIVHPNGRLADKPYGLTEFAVLDPDGNLVTFYRPTKA